MGAGANRLMMSTTVSETTMPNKPIQFPAAPERGLSPWEVATFVFSLKSPLFHALQKETAREPAVRLWRRSVLMGCSEKEGSNAVYPQRILTERSGVQF